MPANLLPVLNRRAFLRSSSLGAIAAIVGYSARGESDALRLAMLADTHIPANKLPGARGYNAYTQLQNIVPAIVATNADGLLLAGDAAQLTGEKEDYAVLLEVLQPVLAEMPGFIALGNHDDREKFFATVTKLDGSRPAVKDKHVTVIEHAAIRIILLDSLMFVRKSGGFLGKVQRDWLAGYLSANTDRPVAIVFHHTLGEGDNDLLDDIRFFQVIAPHSHVKAIFHGHSHRWQVYERQGIPVINLPTSAHIWTPDQPIGWVDATFKQDGMRLELNAFGGNTAENGKEFAFNWK